MLSITLRLILDIGDVLDSWDRDNVHVRGLKPIQVA